MSTSPTSGYGAGGYGEGGYGGVTTDMTKTANVSLTMEEQGNLTVTVSDQSGSAVGSASVTISGPSSDSGTTDSSGQVVFDPVDIGDYNVTVTKDGYFEVTATVSSGDFT